MVAQSSPKVALKGAAVPYDPPLMSSDPPLVSLKVSVVRTKISFIA